PTPTSPHIRPPCSSSSRFSTTAPSTRRCSRNSPPDSAASVGNLDSPLALCFCRQMANKVFVVGVGMTKFEKPGRREGWDYPDMARESGTKALEDAGIHYSEVEQGFVGYCSGDSTSGNRALYELGLTGIPIVNVNNNCSTGSTALFLAAQTIRGGLVDRAIALGFEKMQPGSLKGGAEDRESP